MRSEREHVPAASHADDRLRIVVSPAHGRFASVPPAGIATEGEFVESGQIVGRIGTGDRVTEVRSPWRGWLIAYLAQDGDRVRPSEPLVHLEAF